MAFNTPFKLWKRYSWNGGICDPMMVHWPKGIKAKGEVRDQYTHCSDVVPTVYDCLGIELPAEVKGYTQWPLEGQSFKYSFEDAKAPTQKDTQYYVMLGTRGIWQQGLEGGYDSRRGARRLEPLHRGCVGTLQHRSGSLRVPQPGATRNP